jgi:transcription elongation factor Elf1
VSIKKMENSRHEGVRRSMLHQRIDQIFECPVCGRPLHIDNLVDVKSIVEDILCCVGCGLFNPCCTGCRHGKDIVRTR